MTTIPRLAGATALLISLVAQGTERTEPTWVDVYPARIGVVELDTSSVTTSDGKVFRATWRGGTDLRGGSDYRLTTGEIDCKAGSISRESMRWFSSIGKRGPQAGGQPTASTIYDYTAGTVAFQPDWKPREISSIERDWALDRLTFPEIGSMDGRVVRTVCNDVASFKNGHEVLGEDIQRAIGCPSKALDASSLCKTDLATRELLGQMVQRLIQIHSACGADEKETDSMGDTWIRQAKECPSAGGGCDLSSLRSKVEMLGKDLSRAAAGKQCTAIPRYLKEAALYEKEADEAAETTRSAGRFVLCVESKIPVLDDRTSPADVVAKGVFSVCSSEMTPQLRANATYAELMMPKIIGRVLEKRSQARTPNKAAKK